MGEKGPILDEPLTILTRRPLPGGVREAERLVRAAGGWLRRGGRPPRQSGPGVVLANLLAGLRQIGQEVRLDPSPGRVTRYLGVLSGVDALRWALAAKQRGAVSRLVANPNVATTPLEFGGLLASPGIDRVVTHAAWVTAFYETLAPEVRGRTAEWAVGVDTDYWRDSPSGDARNTMLIYDKLGAEGGELRAAVEAELRRRGLAAEVVRYGSYEPAEYRRLLRRAKAMIVLAGSESQGIAQFEAWSCDVPTLVFDQGRCRLSAPAGGVAASSSPFLTAACGRRFASAGEFPERLTQFLESLAACQPRRQVLERHTLAHGARAYCALFGDGGRRGD